MYYFGLLIEYRHFMFRQYLTPNHHKNTQLLELDNSKITNYDTNRRLQLLTDLLNNTLINIYTDILQLKPSIGIMVNF